MTGVLRKRGNLHRDRHTQREDDVKRHREQTAVYTPRRETWHRSFPHGPREEPTLPTPRFQTHRLHAVKQCISAAYCTLCVVLHYSSHSE